jgi:hypothetical protein
VSKAAASSLLDGRRQLGSLLVYCWAGLNTANFIFSLHYLCFAGPPGRLIVTVAVIILLRF